MSLASPTRRIYIGYDRREDEAYQVCRHSIERRLSRVLPIVKLDDLETGDVFHRPTEVRDGRLWCPISEAPMATEFAIRRFAVPFLQREGWALFMDCDMVVCGDLNELFDLADPECAVMCVKHRQEQGPDTKMDGQVQTFYARKNWSSLMLFNCEHPSNKRLDLKALNSWPGRDLHAFRWLEDDEIGDLPFEWNYLVGVQDPLEIPKVYHFTLGGPWIEGWTGGPLDGIWNCAKDAWQRDEVRPIEYA